MTMTIGALKHRINVLERLLHDTRHQLGVAKNTRKFAYLRKNLVDICGHLECNVPCMQNREKVIRKAPELIDALEQTINLLQVDLEHRIATEDPMDTGIFLDCSEDETEASGLWVWVVVLLLLAGCGLIATGYM